MTWSPASGRSEIEAMLRRIGALKDEEIDLAETALLLAALDEPQAKLERYRHHLSLISRDVAELSTKRPVADSLEARIATLTEILVERYGYCGDHETFDDLQNANMMRVIDRRKGLPVALGILFIHAARQQGWAIDGLNFPGHFLLRLELGSERSIIDPFNGGRCCSSEVLRELIKSLAGEEAEIRPDYYAAVGNRAILMRLENNLKLRLLREERPEQALALLEAMLMLAPGEPQLWREAGLVHLAVGNLRAAIMSFEQVLELEPAGAGQEEARSLLTRLRSRLN